MSKFKLKLDYPALCCDFEKLRLPLKKQGLGQYFFFPKEIDLHFSLLGI